MSLNFQNAGDYAKAVYGDANSQQVGSNGAIAMNNVSSVGMKGGKNKSKKNQSKKNQSKKNQSKKNQRGGKNKSKKNQSKKNQQKGGK